MLHISSFEKGRGLLSYLVSQSSGWKFFQFSPVHVSECLGVELLPGNHASSPTRGNCGSC